MNTLNPDHPHTDPGDGRVECETCGKWVHLVIHSCKGVPVTYAAAIRQVDVWMKRAEESKRLFQEAVAAGVTPVAGHEQEVQADAWDEATEAHRNYLWEMAQYNTGTRERPGVPINPYRADPTPGASDD